jgi:hypothetical protein
MRNPHTAETVGRQPPADNSALNTAEFNKARARFMARVSAPELPALALKLAYVIAFKRMHTDTQTLFIGQEELADEINADERTVRNLLPILQSCGLSIERGNGRGNASTYRIEPDAERRKPEAAFTPERRASRSAFKGERRKFETAKGGNLAQEKAETSFHPSKEEQPRKNNQDSLALPNGRARESAQAAPDFFGPKKEATKEEKVKTATGAADGFEEFWAAYPRKADKPDARKAFARALKQVSAGELIEGARRYAIARQAAIAAGDDPKYTKFPSTWLNKGSWANPTEGGASGTPPPARSRFSSAMEVAERMLAERDAEEEGDEHVLH